MKAQVKNMSVLDKLKIMEFGQIKIIKNKADEFAIKAIMNRGEDAKNGFSVTFSNDYSKIRKDYLQILK